MGSCKILTMRVTGFKRLLVVLLLPADLLGLPILSKLLSRISIRRVTHDNAERRDGESARLVDPNYGAPSSSASPLYDAPTYTTTVSPCASYVTTTTTTTTPPPSYQAATNKPFPDILGFLRQIPEAVGNHFKPKPPPYNPCLVAPQTYEEPKAAYEEPKATYDEPKNTYEQNDLPIVPRINESPDEESSGEQDMLNDKLVVAQSVAV